MRDGLDTERCVRYETVSGLKVRKLQPVIGAEIENVDLSASISLQAAHDIRQALLDHGVVFFQNQSITYEHHVALAKVFGEPIIEGILPVRPEIMPLISNPENKNPAGGHWHSDGTYLKIPPALSILHTILAAPLGGDTCFSSAIAAYEGLSDEVKRRVAPLRARASLGHVRKVKGLENNGYEFKGVPAWAEHPVVRIHPETGKRVLYVNEIHTTHIVELDEQESTELLRHLTDQFKRPEYQMRWAWTDHTVAIWDNRQVQHYAVQNEAGPRHVERIMVGGTPSIGLTDSPQVAAVA